MSSNLNSNSSSVVETLAADDDDKGREDLLMIHKQPPDTEAAQQQHLGLLPYSPAPTPQGSLLVDVAVGFSAAGSIPLPTNINHGVDSQPTEEEEDSEEDAMDTEEEETQVKREGKFSVCDLVWGKVKSHPWWPGQIFHSDDASQRALKYKKKDAFLIAYFGDQTFAWNESSSLNHFHTHFSHMENQSASEAFRAAVDYALDEVFTRVQFGMTCSCTPKFESQILQNAGIRKDAKRAAHIPDISLSATSFEPGKLLRVIQGLALNPRGGTDRLELKISHAQLLSFFRFKGYFQLPEFYAYGGLVEDTSLSPETNDSNCVIEYVSPNEQHTLTHKAKSSESSSRKRKYGSDGGLHPSKKKKSLSDLMDGKKATSPITSNGIKVLDEGAPGLPASSFGRKRKAVHPFSEDSTLKSIKKMASLQRDFDTESPAPQSFKVGECIRRIASQLTGSPPILKRCSLKVPRGSAQLDGNEYNEIDGSQNTPKVPRRKTFTHSNNYPSPPDEMLSQLCLAARDPLKGYSFLTTIIGFFSDFRNSISIEHSGAGKQKRSNKMAGAEPGNSDTRCNTTFDFEEMGDSYWTDRIIQSSPEEQPTRRRKTQGQSSFGLSTEFYTSFDAEEPLQLIVSDFQEQNHDEDYVLTKEKPSRKYRKKKKNSQNVLPTDKNTVVFESASPIDHDVAAELISRSTKDKHINDISLTELLMDFTEPASIPSVIKLNNIFRRFGPLKESETKVLKDTNSARVVFKKQTDAEVACNSAAKFSIFGAVHVRYQLSKKRPYFCNDQNKWYLDGDVFQGINLKTFKV
ncbi:hypothetical protein ACHQM5_000240 [Ranunculus cassubicifolius]